MKKGTVKFFNVTKGFGFIKEDGGEEIFVHATGLIDKIKENDEVVSETQEGKKGINAINVKLA
ncbi:MAG: cold shock domain-containing protein [Sphingobacteriaceae bacterium]|nr:cold shock domain-containing protein [Sphingobacteriaceae bacterium]